MFKVPSDQRDRLWQIESRKLRQDLQNLQSSERLRPVVSDHLTQYFLRVCGQNGPFKKTEELLNDFQSKSLKDIQCKYLKDKGLPLLEATPAAVAKTLFELLSPKGEFHELVETAKQTERHQIKQRIISEQFLPSAVNKNELLRLMIHLKKARRANTNRNFNAHVVDIQDLSTLLRNLQSNPELNNQRVQILVRNELHYTAVDLNLRHHKFSGFVMDASGDSRRMDVIKCLQNMGVSDIYVAGLENSNGSKEKLQFDSFSCPYFSYDHICKSSKDLELFDKLERLPHIEVNGIKSLSWSNLPKSLLKYAQRNSLLNEISPEEDMASSMINEVGIPLNENLEQNKTSHEINPSLPVENTALYKKREHLHQKALSGLDLLSEEDLENIVSS